MADRLGDAPGPEPNVGAFVLDATRTIPFVPTLAELLARRVRADGAAPLITYYDLASGERTELSAITFANWVAKTSNLVVDELMLAPGDLVELALARSHPGHWVTLVWELACWQTGLVVTPDGPAGEARTVVCGPDWSDVDPGGADLVACALHPWGLPFATPLPAGVLDYALEARAQPDVYPVAPVPGGAAAWVDDERRLTQDDLLGSGPQPRQRRLVRPRQPWPTACEALVRPLLDGGSTVLVAGPDDPERVARIRADEQAG
jgi:uncharacterized protein (TIGR03089 family)